MDNKLDEYQSDLIVGRDEEIQFITDALLQCGESNKAKRLLFIAAPHMGKTWLLRHVEDIIKSKLHCLGYIPIYIDCSINDISWGLFLVRLREVVNRANKSCGLNITDGLEITTTKDGAKYLQTVAGQMSFCRFVFLLDNLDKFRVPDGIGPNFVECIQQTEQFWVIATTSSEKVWIESKPEHAAEKRHLPLLRSSDAEELVEKRLADFTTREKQRDRHPDDKRKKLINWIVAQAGYHPGWLQITCDWVNEMLGKSVYVSDLDSDRNRDDLSRRLDSCFGDLYECLQTNAAGILSSDQERTRAESRRSALIELWTRGEAGMNKPPLALNQPGLWGLGVISELPNNGNHWWIPSAMFRSYLAGKLPLHVPWRSVLASTEVLGAWVILCLFVAILSLLVYFTLDSMWLAIRGGIFAIVLGVGGVIVWFVLLIQQRRHLK